MAVQLIVCCNIIQTVAWSFILICRQVMLPCNLAVRMEVLYSVKSCDHEKHTLMGSRFFYDTLLGFLSLTFFTSLPSPSAALSWDKRSLLKGYLTSLNKELRNAYWVPSLSVSNHLPACFQNIYQYVPDVTSTSPYELCILFEWLVHPAGQGESERGQIGRP